MLLRPEIHRPRKDKLIPDADNKFAYSARAFAHGIALDPARYHLTEEDAAAITAAVTAFRNALAKSLHRFTRTQQTVHRKNRARVEAEKMVRKYANIIRADKDISTCDKLLINIRERSTKPKRRNCPSDPPVLIYEGATKAGHHKMRYCQDLGTGSKQKPVGAERVEIAVEFVRVGEKTPKYPESLTGRPWIVRSFSSSPFIVDWPDPSKVGFTEAVRVFYWGRWADKVGEVSAWSKPCVAGIVEPREVVRKAQRDEGTEARREDLRKAA